MDIEVWDTTFIRARRAEVHPVLADPGTYGGWWPGAVSQGTPARARIVLRPPTLLGRRQRLVMEVTKNRRDLGVDFLVSGDLDGRGEWFYLDEPSGVVVNYVLRARVPDRRWRATLRDHRAAVRSALEALKDRLEGSRIPGEEPDRRLLEDQQAAMAAFKAGVEAHARKLAAEREAQHDG